MPWNDEPDELPTRAELARDLLLYVMRDYADEVCASWLVDQEFHFYEAACAGRFPDAKDEAAARVGFCKRLGDLGALANGWRAWPDAVGHRPDRATRFVETTQGVLSYTELAPLLADRSHLALPPGRAWCDIGSTLRIRWLHHRLPSPMPPARQRAFDPSATSGTRGGRRHASRPEREPSYNHTNPRWFSSPMLEESHSG